MLGTRHPGYGYIHVGGGWLTSGYVDHWKEIVWLPKEVASRQEREQDFTRLFFSSLETADLTSAVLGKERRARAQDLCWGRPVMIVTTQQPRQKQAVLQA
jgi:hypothetical protein